MVRRVWVPSSKFIIGTTLLVTVDRWEWTRAGGLIVVYKDGLRCRSEWRTLPEFLRAIREGRENASEVR